jgi:hypothetical protein
VLENIAKSIEDVHDGWWLEYPYYTLRYIGYSAEDQDEGIIEPDWYSIAWVSLLQCLPDEYVVRIIQEPTFPAQASALKYYIVVAEVEEYLKKIAPEKYLTIETFNGNIILVDKTKESTDNV